MSTGVLWASLLIYCLLSSVCALVGQVPVSNPPPAGGRGHVLLRPAGGRCGRLGRQHLAGSWLGEHALWTVPLGRDHEQSSSVCPSECAGEAAAVELDRLQHLAAFADADAALVGDVAVPHCAVGVEADAVGDALSELGPDPAVREAAVGGDVEGGESPGIR